MDLYFFKKKRKFKIFATDFGQLVGDDSEFTKPVTPQFLRNLRYFVVPSKNVRPEKLIELIDLIELVKLSKKVYHNNFSTLLDDELLTWVKKSPFLALFYPLNVNNS